MRLIKHIIYDILHLFAKIHDVIIFEFPRRFPSSLFLLSNYCDIDLWNWSSILKIFTFFFKSAFFSFKWVGTSCNIIYDFETSQILQVPDGSEKVKSNIKIISMSFRTNKGIEIYKRRNIRSLTAGSERLSWEAFLYRNTV